jgi:ribonuclease HI
MTTTVYTDGACSGSPGRGGWAWIVDEDHFASGHTPETTNQRMEMTAVLEAVNSIEGPLIVASDSAYVINCFEQRWHERWLKNDWRSSSGKPVANRDLWEPLITAVTSRGDVSFLKVKGHSGDPMNERADQLAVSAKLSTPLCK